MSAPTLELFASDPVASLSGQFPLGRVEPLADPREPSAADLRPWGLRGMHRARHQGDPVHDHFTYDHRQQVAVNADGELLIEADATANKVTNNDGDEGPSEDYTYDYCPDYPNT